jgi:DNA-binding NtrC family response regulator
MSHMKERILVVDDEETWCQIISSVLNSVGYECSVAHNGVEALAVLDRDEEFALLISNLMMAEMDGFVLLERTKDRFPDMPFVMETGVHDSSVIVKAYRDGAYDYLIKPFTPDWLLAAARRVLEYRRLKLANRAYKTRLAKDAVAAQGESCRERILIVDGDEGVRDIFSSMLTSAGYQCRTADGGIEALAILKSGEEFDLLTSELYMPDGDGMVLLERTKDRFPDIPFVMVTGTYDDAVIAAAYREGVYDYILKPFNVPFLNIVARRALQYRRLKIENQAYQAELAKIAKAGLDGL